MPGVMELYFAPILSQDVDGNGGTDNGDQRRGLTNINHEREQGHGDEGIAKTDGGAAEGGGEENHGREEEELGEGHGLSL